jgi:hypothetical protein
MYIAAAPPNHDDTEHDGGGDQASARTPTLRHAAVVVHSAGRSDCHARVVLGPVLPGPVAVLPVPAESGVGVAGLPILGIGRLFVDDLSSNGLITGGVAAAARVVECPIGRPHVGRGIGLSTPPLAVPVGRNHIGFVGPNPVPPARRARGKPAAERCNAAVVV